MFAKAMEKSPSPVYGARLELVYGLIAHRGFESLLLRQKITKLRLRYFLCQILKNLTIMSQGDYHSSVASLKQIASEFEL